MIRGKLVKALVLWSAVIVVLLITAGGVIAVRRGFSARENPSALETYVAKTAQRFWPICVFPLPSLPWQMAQSLSTTASDQT